jgi:hypothetical protein
MKVLDSISDPWALVHLIANTDDPVHQRLALARLEDPSAIIAVAKMSLELNLCINALARVNDPALLEDAAAGADLNSVRKAARKALEKFSRQAEAAKAKRLISEAGTVDAIANPVDLATIAKAHEDIRVSRQATRMLDDLALLRDIATTSAHSDVRIEAVARIADPDALVDIATGGNPRKVRVAALSRVDSQEILADIALHEKDESLRIAAIPRVTDQAVLSTIAKDDPEASVRMEAIGHITDQAVLSTIAKDDPEASVRMEAIRHITDRTVWADVRRCVLDGSDLGRWVAGVASSPEAEHSVRCRASDFPNLSRIAVEEIAARRGISMERAREMFAQKASGRCCGCKHELSGQQLLLVGAYQQADGVVALGGRTGYLVELAKGNCPGCCGFARMPGSARYAVEWNRR